MQTGWKELNGKDAVVYEDGIYTLGQKNGAPYLSANGRTYALSCHPYEPCLYIKDGNGLLTAVHNAFDPSYVIEAFYNDKTVTSITGYEYSAKDFCRMVEYAAGSVDINIDGAEKIFQKKKHQEKAKEKNRVFTEQNRPENGGSIEDDPFYAEAAKYPDSVIDYRLVKDDMPYDGYESHRRALVFAFPHLCIDEDGEVIWRYDAGKADGRRISAEELFAPVQNGEKLNYRKAFLQPPYTNNYTDADFDKLNATLFPNGTDCLEIYEWTTDWSDYFDEGHEWWGALCLTVYDKSLDRYAVITASATD